jgi:hypothetical protein
MNLDYVSMEKEILFNWFEGLIIKSFETLEGKPLKCGKLDYYKQEFFKQYFTHFLSIKILTPGLRIHYEDRENEITALASVLVLIRASLENFSMFYYIYRSSDDFQDIYFRFWSWFREGLMNRQRLSSNYFPDKLKDEKREIGRILSELQEYKSYHLLKDKRKERYDKEGKWCFLSKQELLEKAGFSKPLSKNCYNFFSSFTHPTSSGHLQTSQADFKTSNKMLNTMLKPLFICSGLYLQSYSFMFKEVEKLLNEKDQEFVKTWSEVGAELMKESI